MGTDVKYYNVTFNDSQNGIQKTYKLESGSTISISGTIHNINKDTTINVILPQLSAVSLWDANKDGIINKKDATIINEKDYKDYQFKMAEYLRGVDEEDYPAYLEAYPDYCASAEKLNDALIQSNSKYRLSCDGGGYHYGVGDNGYFGVLFKTLNEDNPEEKSIVIRTPENIEATQRYEAELEKIKEEQLDKKFAQEHPFLAKIGMTRQQYEKIFN